MKGGIIFEENVIPLVIQSLVDLPTYYQADLMRPASKPLASSLIVTTPERLPQWTAEMSKYRSLSFCCFVGKDKKKLRHLSTFQQYDVIFTTYSALRSGGATSRDGEVRLRPVGDQSSPGPWKLLSCYPSLLPAAAQTWSKAGEDRARRVECASAELDQSYL